MIVIDTSVLVDSFTGPRRSLQLLGDLLDRGERVIMTSIVLYEWLRGPRVRQEIVDQEDIFRSESVIAFDNVDAARAADLYKTVRSPRGREIDIAIAAMALNREAAIWTLNSADFGDIPNLRLIRTHPAS
jgi:predicted nucleic acid-binding protein